MGDGMSLWYKLTSWLPLFGYGVGFLFARMNSMKKYVVLILSLVIVTVLLTKVIPSIFHNSIFSTFSSQVDIDVDPNRFIGINSDGDTLRVKDLNSEYTVLHYWSTACGACKLEMIDYDKLLSDDLGNDIEIYPIKIDLERDSPNDFLYNFDFSEQRIIPLHCTNGESKSSFSIKTLPTSIVIRNKKQIISIGTFQEAIENISYHK
ncbi:MAG: Redoxin [Bacteroidota bacterium]